MKRCPLGSLGISKNFGFKYELWDRFVKTCAQPSLVSPGFLPEKRHCFKYVIICATGSCCAAPQKLINDDILNKIYTLLRYINGCLIKEPHRDI